MKTKNKIMILAGLGLFIIMIIGAWSLRYVMTAVSSLTAEIEQASRELSATEAVTTELATLSENINHFIADKDSHRREACEVSRTAVHRMLDALIAQDSDPVGRSLPALLHGSFGSVESDIDRIFSLQDPAGRDREPARHLLLETVRHIAFMNADVVAFRKGTMNVRISQIADRTRTLRASIVLFVVMTLLTAGFLLFGFTTFIRHAVSLPLNELREGVRAFSGGNLDYRLHVDGTDEISVIAGQMNGMADSLKQSRSELEKKLSASTNARASLGRIEAAVRHEINNPLTTVIGNVELLIERYGHKDKELTARLEVVLNNSLRIAEITKKLQEIKKENSTDYHTGGNMTDVK